jgi:hypothetical protein
MKEGKTQGFWSRTLAHITEIGITLCKNLPFYKGGSIKIAPILLLVEKIACKVKLRLLTKPFLIMPKTALESQFKTLEEPQDAVVVSIDRTPKRSCEKY